MNSERDLLRIFPRHEPLSGRYSLPGDKSITHRALFLAAMRRGETIIRGYSPAYDCLNTLHLIRQLGCSIREDGEDWIIDGSTRRPPPPLCTIDCGNSGTTARLGAGFLTGESGVFQLIGDPSLTQRPMGRVAEPLRKLGAQVLTTNGKLPLTVIADGSIEGIPKEILGSGGSGDRIIDTSSAQVHGALVIAALRSVGGAALRRTKEMRDHTLRMVKKFGWRVDEVEGVDIVHPIAQSPASGSLNGTKRSEDRTLHLTIPGDISSAAFLVTAALLVPGSDIQIENVGLNPTRIGFLNVVQEMGGDVQWELDESDWEPVGSLRVRYSPELKGVEVQDGSAISPASLIDELPLLALLGASASGVTTLRNAEELRVKESDRISTTVELMRSLGVQIEEFNDGFQVAGSQQICGGGELYHNGDHRLAMMAGVAGLIATEPVLIAGADVVNVSWPGFWGEITVHGA
ncbi:MAG: 3-phosphoshikimate 1-carboxyvinyltransferase [Ignavibacteriae bacterium]|nr:3-phosphoshikimate 1-carboxyvinyltransferase [Ignavibacteriota bacterium]MCB9215526.1 3-phosphoshikimate 1-carboxyvinyltransferase [Ignavibacteria bacterium]